jgi:hypothetical protein
MKKDKRKCEVCEKEIEVYKEYNLKGAKSVKSSGEWFSDDGVYFEESKIWFCLDCWKELTKEKFKTKIPRCLR